MNGRLLFFRLVVTSIVSPPLLLACDSLTFMYRGMEQCLDRYFGEDLVIFMYQYGNAANATQVFLGARVDHSVHHCIQVQQRWPMSRIKRNPSEPLDSLNLSPMEILYFNLGMSLFSLLYEGFYIPYITKNSMGMTYKEYFKYVMTMGAGIPFSAIKNGKKKISGRT